MAKKRSKSINTKFAELPKRDQKRISRQIVRYFARGGYKTVHGPDQANRRWTSAENGGETSQLPASERNRLIALARNAARNSEHFEGILHQLETNVIGTEGGKAIFNFPAGFEEAGKTIKREFAKWAKSAEYFDDLNLQRLLKIVLRTLLVGGDCVLVFDWDVTSANAGQIITFEPDCIGNLAEKDLAAHFPGLTQHQGILKNAEGKTVGVVCSWAERGQTEYRLFDGDKRLAWTPVKPAGIAWEDSPFTIVRTLQRVNQMRGASRFWSGLATIIDISDYQGYEVQAAKKNAQTVATIEQQVEQNEGEIAGEIDPYAEGEAGEGGEGGESAAFGDDREQLELDNITATGAIYDVLPPGVKLSLWDQKHPNTNLIEFVKALNRGVAFAGGLGSIHSSGEAVASYSGAIAEFILSQTEFKDQFHELEIMVLDWALSNWAKFAQAHNIIPSDDRLPEDWRHTCVTWQRPPERVLDAVKEQAALNSGLKNGTILYRDKLGPDWRGKIDAFAEEVEYFKAKGLTHPSEITVAGAIIEQNQEKED